MTTTIYEVSQNEINELNQFKGTKDDLKNTLEIKGITTSHSIFDDGINCNKTGNCIIYASSEDYKKTENMIKDYGWSNVQVKEKDKGYYQVQGIYTDYIHKNGGWNPKNAEMLGIPDGRVVMYPNQVPGLTKSEVEKYDKTIGAIYITHEIAQVNGTYLTAKYVNESPAYNKKISDNTYRGKRNSSVDFTNGKGKSTLKKHYEEHRKDFQVSGEKDYLNQAQNFLQKTPTPTTQSFVSQEGTYFRYDTATNEFGIINQYGGISTYFKPDIPNYWEIQMSKYAPK